MACDFTIAGQSRVFQGLENCLTTPTKNAMESIATAITQNLAEPVSVMLTLYIILQGYNLVRGQRHFGVPDMMSSVMKIGVIVFLVLNYTNYHKNTRQK